MIVVADASPLICFAILGKLETLDIIFTESQKVESYRGGQALSGSINPE
jgi:hypothetical protein